MPLTMDDIISTLAPIHEAIAKVGGWQLVSVSKALCDFTETTRQSMQLQPASQIGGDDHDEIIRLRARLATLDAHQHALQAFVKELMPRLQEIWDIGGVHSWVVQDRCRDAIEAINGLLARNNLSSPEGRGLQHVRAE